VAAGAAQRVQDHPRSDRYEDAPHRAATKRFPRVEQGNNRMPGRLRARDHVRPRRFDFPDQFGFPAIRHDVPQALRRAAMANATMPASM
jgi:hypothetical protein